MMHNTDTAPAVDLGMFSMFGHKGPLQEEQQIFACRK